MTALMPYIPPNVYLLADNLDAALAAGEDMLTATLVWNGGSGDTGAAIASARRAERIGLAGVRTLEQVLVARILKSRERAEELGKRDPRFGVYARLYTSGTVQLIEAVSEFGDPSPAEFETGDGALAYLRSRGLVDDELSAPLDGTPLPITDDFLIARRVRVGMLMDLVAMFLDQLETHYDLFDDEALPEDRPLPGEAPAADDTSGVIVAALERLQSDN